VTASPFRSYGRVLDGLRAVVRRTRLLRLRLAGRGRLTFGRNFVVGAGADLRPPHFGVFGDNVAVGKNFTAEADFRIGPEVLISSNVSFIGNQHAFDDPSNTVYRQGRLDDDVIEIEGDNLIGFGTIVVGTVRIGRGCIVGAGSVVVHDLPPDTICAGVPARPLRPRYPDGSASGGRGT
jgi:acetyltransferase-like isoleucine patch superfamily enzyme